MTKEKTRLKKIIIAAAVVLLVVTGALALTGVIPVGGAGGLTGHRQGEIFLYGEYHAEPVILERELELWNTYYHENGMRDLFIEQSYYTAQFLNQWMQADNDDILEQIYADWEGSLSHSQNYLNFYRQIKADCPETVFHGTDVGHQYATTGVRYLKYLEENGQKDSEEYQLTREAIEQGKRYERENGNDVYRENMMVENFIREFDKLRGKDVMGIYGSSHTDIEAMEYNTGLVPCMANQLAEHYSEKVHSEDLSVLLLLTEPLAVETISVDGKEYTASYFGEVEVDTSLYQKFAYWRLEDAYEDFKDCPTTNYVCPYNNFPMEVKAGQILIIDATRKEDGVVERRYYRADGELLEGQETTRGIMVGEYVPTEPLAVETISIGGKEYTASYFGEVEVDTSLYQKLAYWRLEDAYEDFKDYPATNDVSPYDGFPMEVKTGQILIVDGTRKSDGKVERLYYRADGELWNGRKAASNIVVDE